MDNNDVFSKNNRANYVKSLNTSKTNNEAQRLEEKVKSYNNNIRSNKNISNNKFNYDNQNTTVNRINQSRSKSNGVNRAVTNEVASKGVQAVGVPKPIADAAVKSKIGQKALNNVKRKTPALNLLDRLTGGNKSEVEEQASDGGGQSFTVPLKVIKWTLVMSAPVFSIIVFCCLFISASQIFIKAIGLGNADSLGTKEAEEKINKKMTDDENLDANMYLDDTVYTFAKSKLMESNLEQTASKYIERKYNEADLSRIEDFYPAVVDLSKNYDENMVYDFYFKMYNLYRIYRDNYNVYLDLPLLMATLNLQSEDMYVVFSSNLDSKDRAKTARKDYSDMDYYYAWNYTTTKDTSTHDMEVLAQHMVSEKASSECESPVNGICYVIDEDKYYEFLKEFIEKKYYLDEQIPLSNNNTSKPPINTPVEPSNPSIPSDNTSNGDFRTWTQCGQSWSNILIPNSDVNVCSAGCLLTSITIQIARSGTYTYESPINPGVALNYYTFASGGLFAWNSTTNLAPNFKYLTEVSLVGMRKSAIIEKLNSYDSSKYYIVLAVSPFSVNSITHYVAFDYADSNNIYMMDPSSVNNKELYSIYKLYSARIFVKED